jgi:hypothetical protein
MLARAALAEIEDPAATAAATHVAAHKPEPDADEQQEGQPGDQDLGQNARPLRGFRTNRDAVLQEVSDQGGITRIECLEAGPVGTQTLDALVLNGDFADRSIRQLLEELAVA